MKMKTDDKNKAGESLPEHERRSLEKLRQSWASEGALRVRSGLKAGPEIYVDEC